MANKRDIYARICKKVSKPQDYETKFEGREQGYLRKDESTKKEILRTEQLGKHSRELEEIKADSSLRKRCLNSFLDQKNMKPFTDNLEQKQKFYFSRLNCLR